MLIIGRVFAQFVYVFLPSDVKILFLRITLAQLLANFVPSVKKVLDLLFKAIKSCLTDKKKMNLNLKLMRVSNVDLHLCCI